VTASNTSNSSSSINATLTCGLDIIDMLDFVLKGPSEDIDILLTCGIGEILNFSGENPVLYRKYFGGPLCKVMEFTLNFDQNIEGKLVRILQYPRLYVVILGIIIH
jgi:hypothetical protein